MKAMILAAGLGSRFLPLTNDLPKPLFPLFNRPLIFHTLDWLRANGVSQVMINLHHLGDMVRQAVGDGRRWGIKIRYSWEEELLGTGGGLKKVADFFKGQRFLLVNSDVFLNADIGPAMVFHKRKKSVATMLLAQADVRRYGAVGVDSEGRICRVPWKGGADKVRPARQGVFSGAHILEPEIFDYLPDGVSCINRAGYQAMLEAGRPVHAHFGVRLTGGLSPWYDLGEPDTYLNAHWRIMEMNIWQTDCVRAADGFRHLRCGEFFPGVRMVPPVVIGNNCMLTFGSRIGPYAVLGNGARVREGAVVERSVLLPGARVGANQKIVGEIWGEKAHITVKENGTLTKA